VAFLEAASRLINRLRYLLSNSGDQGKEMSRHTDLTARTGVTVYFADPHSPWQRGSN
jgi:IS30 family transposase